MRQDHAEAVRWYRLAAVQGHTDAQFNLGVMYVQGIGMTQDNARAPRWYRKAAEQNVADSQKNLGFIVCCGNEACLTTMPRLVRW